MHSFHKKNQGSKLTSNQVIAKSTNQLAAEQLPPALDEIRNELLAKGFKPERIDEIIENIKTPLQIAILSECKKVVKEQWKQVLEEEKEASLSQSITASLKKGNDSSS